MKKTFAFIFAGVFAFMALSSCSDDKEDEIIPDDNGGGGQQEEYDEAYYASKATVTSTDPSFTATDDGGTIDFMTAGGSVTVNVSCGCVWTVDNDAEDLFPTTVTSTGFTVTAEQNTIEEELTGTIIVKTGNDGIVFATIEIVQAAYGAPEITVAATEWSVPAKGVLTTDIVVEANADWTAEAADSWLTVTKTDSGVSLTASENEDTQSRSTKVTLTCTDGIKTAYAYIDVNQTAAAYVTLSVESLSFESDASSGTVVVTSNYDWDCSYDSNWFSVTASGGTLTVAVEENEGEAREGTVTITAGDGAENVAEAQLTITQAEPEPEPSSDMVFVYKVSSSSLTITLPLSGEVNCTVNWGDKSSTETVKSEHPTHTYSSADEYTITISGTVTALSNSGISNSPITAVESWGNTGLTSMDHAFSNCYSLASLPVSTGDALAEVTSFDYTFYYCYSLTEISEDIFAKSTKVTGFAHTFEDCGFEEIPAGLFANCTKVTTFTNTFDECADLSVIPDGLFDDCTEVTSFFGVFNNCSGITKIPSDLFSKNLNVTDFSYALSYCSSCTSESPYSTLSDGTKVHLYEREKYTDELGCVAPKSYTKCFSSCKKMSDYNDIPSAWGGGGK